MDSIPPVSSSASTVSASSSSAHSSGLETASDPADDPYSSGPQTLPYIVGALIALMTATIPLLTVVMGRPMEPSPQTIGESGSLGAIPKAWGRELAPPSRRPSPTQR